MIGILGFSGNGYLVFSDPSLTGVQAVGSDHA